MKINTAIIGYGLSGRFFHGSIMRGMSKFKVTSVVTTNPERQAQAKEDFGQIAFRTFDQVLEDPAIELVIITTNNQSHFELAEKALRAHKHVVLEKPFTVTAHDALRLMDTAQETQQVLTVYHNRRYDSDFLTLTQIINEEAVGRIVEFQSSFERFRPQVRDRWREQNLPGSGILYDLGPHLIDQALFHFGLPDEIYADISNQRRGEVHDAFEIILYYDELKVTLKSSMLVNGNLPRFVLHGTKGSFIKYGLDVQEDALRAGQVPSDIWGMEPEDQWGQLITDVSRKVESLPGDYRHFYEEVYEAIRHGKPMHITGEDGFKVMKVIEAALKSNQLKKRITFKH